MTEPDPDATIIVGRKRAPAPTAKPSAKPAAKPPPPAPEPRTPRRALMIGGGVGAFFVIAAGGGAAWHFTRPAPAPQRASLSRPPVPQAPSLAPAPPPAPTPVALPTRHEAEILAQRPDDWMVARFAPNPRIVVIDFPSLLAQGRTFNRMAAYIEKAGQPRDRVLGEGELEEAIRRDQATAETYYYGHDYRAADIARFYAAADRQGMRLNAEEERLRAILRDAGLFVPGSTDAVITIPREGSDSFADASGRFSLLRHELSHGEYFTNPDYADFVGRFWRSDMTEADRTAFRNFLTRQGYEPKDEDLLINEMQAHLMHTTDQRYFNPREVGLPPQRIAQLRARFLETMPRGWLQAATSVVLARLP